jgi:hypothetical protein
MSRVLSRGLAGLSLTAAAVLGAPAAAHADDVIVLPAGLACAGFDLSIGISPGRAQVRVVQDHAGRPVRIIVAGTGNTLDLTNLSTGQTVHLRSNGAVSRSTTNPDGTTTVEAMGHTLIILFPTDTPPGPSTTLYTGRLVYTTTADQVFTVVSAAGQTRDLCAELS